MICLTKEAIAKEYARLHYPENKSDLKELYREGLEVFGDLSQFEGRLLLLSLDEFALAEIVEDFS